MRKPLVLAALLAAAPAAAAPAIDSWPALSLPGTPARGIPEKVRITAPHAGRHLPLILFSHGAAYSGDDYLPLTRYWAEHGFVVIQPTHLDAKSLNLAASDPRRATNWKQRRDDMIAALDGLDALIAQAPALKGRIDRTRVVVAGHSFGGMTTSLLLGATVADPVDGVRRAMGDPRILGGVMLSAPGGYDGLTETWKARGAYLKVDWSKMAKPALVVMADGDDSIMSTRGPVWHEDPYRGAPAGHVCMMSVKRVGHFLGGVSPLDPANKTDPADPAAVALVERASLAWLNALVAQPPRSPVNTATVFKRDPMVSAEACR